MNYLRIDLTGHKFGKWTVLGPGPINRAKKQYRWRCRCECGTERDVLMGALRNGASKSCGCEINRVHGLCGTPEYKSWDSMKQRCLNEKHKSYPDYGGRGIKICAAILFIPTSIVNLLGKRPSRLLSIDRINVNGHYSCGTCDECVKNSWVLNIRWATPKMQCRNKRNNRIADVGGDAKTVSEWSEVLGINKDTLYRRLNRGEVGSAFVAPLHEHRKFTKVFGSV